MPRFTVQFETALVLGALGLALCGPVDARQRQPKPPKAEVARPANPGAIRPKAGQGNLRGIAGLPPKWVDNLQQMSPEEQERFMRNNARFQNLPPERQQQIRNRLQQWNRLTPEQRNAFEQRERVLESLTPEQRNYIRTQLLPQWRALPQERRQVLLGRLRALQGMNDQQREDLLNDPKFTQGLSPDEQNVLKGLNTLRNPPE